MSRPVPPEIPEESGVARRPGLVFPLLGVAGFFVILMLAATVQGHPVFRPVGDPKSIPTRTPVPEPVPTTSGMPEFEPPEDSLILTIITAVVVILIGGVLLVVVFLGVRLLVRTLLSLWHGRRPRRRGGAEIPGAVAGTEPAASTPDAVEIRRGISDALVALERDEPPTGAIVAAWMSLEESAADAGVVRAPSETAAEFTVRILARRSSLASDVSRLLRLYEDVRFGGRIATEHDRDTAVRCLRAIEEGWR
ncbi:DUF4129 domain-containing protein [Microbacterium sp. NPDC089695]|uniref:DUF4129 domain-containing protein n=1 Tax=Microbacterium sp. NPDC089695 TaxID=3364198 RepID=UPI00381DE148